MWGQLCTSKKKTKKYNHILLLTVLLVSFLSPPCPVLPSPHFLLPPQPRTRERGFDKTGTHTPARNQSPLRPPHSPLPPPPLPFPPLGTLSDVSACLDAEAQLHMRFEAVSFSGPFFLLLPHSYCLLPIVLFFFHRADSPSLCGKTTTNTTARPTHTHTPHSTTQHPPNTPPTTSFSSFREAIYPLVSPPPSRMCCMRGSASFRLHAAAANPQKKKIIRTPSFPPPLPHSRFAPPSSKRNACIRPVVKRGGSDNDDDVERERTNSGKRVIFFNETTLPPPVVSFYFPLYCPFPFLFPATEYC